VNTMFKCYENITVKSEGGMKQRGCLGIYSKCGEVGAYNTSTRSNSASRGTECDCTPATSYASTPIARAIS